MTVRCSCRTGCDRPTARRQSTIPMLLSFQRPDAKKARPPRLHDPTRLRKRRAGRSRRFGRRAREHECSARAEADPSRSAAACVRARDRPAHGRVECPPGTRRPASDPRRPWQSRLLPHRRFRSTTPRRRRCGAACACARRGSRSRCWPGSRSGIVSLFYGFMTALAQDLPQFEVAQLAQQSNGVIYADDGKTVLGVLRSDQYRVLVHWNEIAPGHAQRGGRDRGPALLPARRDRPGRHGARRRRQHLDGHARAGRLDDHPAARQEPLEARTGRHALAAPQDHRGRARLPGRAALVEAEDPRGVPQHDLLRPSGLRRRGRRGGVLRRARQGPAAAAGRAARRPRAEPDGQRPGQHPQAALERRTLVLAKLLRAGLHRRLRVPPRRFQAAAAARAGRSASRPRRRRSRTTSSTTCASS